TSLMQAIQIREQLYRNNTDPFLSFSTYERKQFFALNIFHRIKWKRAPWCHPVINIHKRWTERMAPNRGKGFEYIHLPGNRHALQTNLNGNMAAVCIRQIDGSTRTAAK